MKPCFSFLEAHELAAAVPCHVQTIRAMLKDGRLTPGRKIGRVPLFAPDDVEIAQQLIHRSTEQK